MKIFFALNHPAHYHLFKNVAGNLRRDGHDTVFVIKGKDVLEPLLVSDGCSYFKIAFSGRRLRGNAFSIGASLGRELFTQDRHLWKLARRARPDLLVGTDVAITHIGRLLRIPSIVFNEDDFSVNKLFCKSAYPFASWIVSPEVCDVGKYRLKKIAYPGYQKLAYLHPSCFTPNEEVVRRINPDMDRYFVIRQVSFLAGHDIEKSHGGFSRPLLREIISLLESRGKVFMTSEGRLGDEFKPYELRIEPKNLHHILFYADLFIGDSQSVTMEAALLGTPAIRFNSFVGKISVLEELEKVYRLTAGVKNTEPAALINLVKSLLGRPGLKAEFRERRFRMLKEKIDVTAFLTWFFEAYPQSAKIVRADPCYTSRFLTTAPYLP